MQTHQLMSHALQVVWALFIFAYGACLGSLINVIVYRMPRGLSIVSPPSRCPSCNTRLGWRDNIPVLGWLALRGRCRYCQTKISPEYPIVEAAVGLLFVAFYLLWYVVPPRAVFLGINWGGIRPEWFLNDASLTWPTFVLLLILLGSLVAMTIVDAKTFTIPLILTWVPAIAAVLIHPLHALWLEHRALFLPRPTPGYLWAIPTPGVYGWPAIGAALGAILGLLISNILLWIGLIRPSFADYAEWESTVLAAGKPAETADADRPALEVAAVDDVTIGGAPAVPKPPPSPAPTVNPDAQPADLWIQYPHARREMFKELAFLGPAALLGLAGWYIAIWAAGVQTDPWSGEMTASIQAPLWLSVLAGVLIGYLVGGGIVWAVRILGSLGFGKEAMGLGDVHLMAAVGACLGWIDSTLAFFGAAFVGIAWAILGRLFSGVLPRAMPYGPFLAIATVLVLLLKPAIERGLSLLLHYPVNIP
jgi:leader peptidase (prepilin peptidase) / N-methyltransferase